MIEESGSNFLSQVNTAFNLGKSHVSEFSHVYERIKQEATRDNEKDVEKQKKRPLIKNEVDISDDGR